MTPAKEVFMASRPNPQELYRHFKGNLYQIITIATHSETRQEMVVYQALYGDYKVYVRPLDMFMSEVDHVKYPDVKQKMRFEKVTREAVNAGSIETSKDTSTATASQSTSVYTPERAQKSSFEDKRVIKPQTSPFKFDRKPPEKSAVMSKSIDEEARELNLNPLVIQFMDADLAVDKSAILNRLRPVITNDMIDIMALSLGVVVNEGDVYDRYNDLMTCLTTMEKYESTRLRS